MASLEGPPGPARFRRGQTLERVRPRCDLHHTIPKSGQHWILAEAHNQWLTGAVLCCLALARHRLRTIRDNRSQPKSAIRTPRGLQWYKVVSSHRPPPPRPDKSTEAGKQVIEKQYTYAEAATILRVADSTLRRWGVQRACAMPSPRPTGPFHGRRPNGGPAAFAGCCYQQARSSRGAAATSMTPPPPRRSVLKRHFPRQDSVGLLPPRFPARRTDRRPRPPSP
jgi:hypothetical protein